MKVAIFLFGFLAVAYAQDKPLFSKCPDFKLTYPELKTKVDLHNVLGPWNLIRKSVFEQSKFEKFDCLRELYYRDPKGDQSEVKYIRYGRSEAEKGHTHKLYFGQSKLKGLEGTEVDNFFEQSFQDPEFNEGKEVKSEGVLVDSDGGETWGLWVTCTEFEPTNTTVTWMIASRYPWIDARLEQRLVERIEKYGGVGATQLRGVGQTDCYKNTNKA